MHFSRNFWGIIVRDQNHAIGKEKSLGHYRPRKKVKCYYTYTIEPAFIIHEFSATVIIVKLFLTVKIQSFIYRSFLIVAIEK